MSTYRLDKLFSPRSVAVVGGSPRQTSPGRAVLRNLRAAGFKGAIGLVNPHYDEIEGVRAVKTVHELPEPPDLVVIAAPAQSVPGIVTAAGEKGTAAAIIVTAGLGHGPGSLADACEKAARATGLRLVGPNCLGVLSSRAKLNASFAARMPAAGDLALISQSGAIATGLIEWSAVHDIGFSAAVSLGDAVDVDFGDLLDFFALDGTTRAILLYVESITNARKFMSAARAAARIKPVVVVKSGRHAQGAKAAQTHTGALAGSDAVYEAAFRRAGLLRVLDLDELFAAAETLGRVRPFPGKRLAILTNGGGIGVLAVDRLADLGGTLAGLSAPTMKKLDAALPPIWSHANPVDIAGDADAARYIAALEALIADEENDAILVMNVPTALASSELAARSVAGAAHAHRNSMIRPKPFFAVWVGTSDAVTPIFEAAGMPSYATESDAVRGFMHLVRYREALDALMVTPASLPQDFKPDVAAARAVVENAVRRGRTWLDPIEATRLLAAYGIPIAPALLARDPDEAAAVAAPLLAGGSTVVAKILSPDIVHKSEVGGVRLNLTSEGAVRAAVADILARARAARPDARITGVTIHPMVLRPKARELIAGNRGRSDLRPRHRIRPRRHRGRGHRRQGAGAAAARSRARTRPHCAHARGARAEGLPRRAGGRHRCRRAPAGQARAARRRSCRSCASSISTRCWPTRTGSSPSMPALWWLRSSRRAAGRRAILASPSGPIPRTGSVPPRCVTERGCWCARCGPRTSRCTGLSSPRSPSRICVCVSSRR